MTDLPDQSSNTQGVPYSIPTDTSNVGVLPGQQIQPTAGGIGGKEKEVIKPPEGVVEEVGALPEVSPELKEVGVEKISETVELPQPVSGLTGMTPAGPSAPVSTAQPLTVKLPLTDDQIKKGLHQKVYDSILWLAYWCLRQIKVAQAKITRKETL